MLDVLRRQQSLVDAKMGFNANKEALHNAMMNIYKQVTKTVDGKGVDLTVTKPYIAYLMSPPTAFAVTNFLQCILDYQNDGWTFQL